MRRMGAVVVALAVLAAACGSSDSNDNEKAATTTTAPALDEARAQAVLLQQSDFPAGWTSSPSDTSEDSDTPQLDAEFYRCVGASNPDDHQVLEADSPDFSSADKTLQASSSLQVARSEAAAREDLRALQSEKFPRCMQQVLNDKGDELFAKDAPGVTIRGVEVQRLQVALPGDGAAYRVLMHLAAEGQQVDASLDLLGFLTGRTEVSLMLTGVGTPFPADVAGSLAKKVGDRLAASR